jgi:hypothetical protein
MGWRNIFPVLLLCQFFGCGGNNLADTYLPYQLCRCVFFLLRQKKVLVAQVGFLVVAEKSFRCYFLTYHTSCAVVSVFLLRREIFFGYSVSKKNSYLVSLIER